jgi:hypothetical protein
MDPQSQDKLSSSSYLSSMDPVPSEKSFDEQTRKNVEYTPSKVKKQDVSFPEA